jgi:glycosyltransferase involved in cell wall biosynthesis
MKKIITIGVLAYNESEVIAKMLESLLSQSVFNKFNTLNVEFTFHIIVVPNGCKDNTFQIAKETLNKYKQDVNLDFSYEVKELEQPGKSNAWNCLVHNLSPENTAYFVFVDADIEFGTSETISKCLINLRDNEKLLAVTDAPLKKFHKNDNWFIKYVSSKFSSNYVSNDEHTIDAICGQFYCARAPIIKSIWLPLGLSVEDGYIYTMIISENFTSQIDLNKVLRVAGTFHYYQGLTNFFEIIKHEVRLVIGTTLNAYLIWDTFYFLINPNSNGAGEIVKELNNNKVNWYSQFVNNAVNNRGLFVIPLRFLIRRFSGYSNKSVLEKIYSLPKLAFGIIFDLIVYVIANFKIKSKSAVGFW